MICRIIIIFLLLAMPCLGSCLKTDLNKDGVVDAKDLGILMSHWLERSDCLSSNYLTFNGSTGYVSNSHSNLLDFGSGDFSVCFWMNNTLIKNSNIFSNLGATAGYLVGFSFDLSSLVLITKNAGTTSQAGIPYSNALASSWHHVIINRTGSTVSSFIDAQSVSVTGTAKSGNINTVANNIIGKAEVTFANFDYYGGFIDDLRAYRGMTISQAQATAMFNGGIGTKYVKNETPTASVAWNMDEGTGNTITDAQGGLVSTFSATGVTWQSGGVPFESSGDNMGDIFSEGWYW